MDRENLVSVILDSEIEPPRASNPGLPDIACLIISLLLALMAQVFNEQRNLLSKSALDLRWNCVELAGKIGTVDDAHRARGLAV